MSQFPLLLLLASPQQEGEVRGEGQIAHMAYRVDPGPRLMRLSRQMPGQGGLLYLSTEKALEGNLDFLCMQLVRECAAREYRGVLLDLSSQCCQCSGRLLQRVESVLGQNRLTLYVPEPCAKLTRNAKLLVSTAISGGTLRQRLQDAIGAYGKERVVPAVEKTAEDFQPPSRTGSGKALSPNELQELRQRLRPGIYWSPELCARYFTYFEPGGRAHFVLFDDGETIRAKLRLAGELGLTECVVPWCDYKK